VVSPCLSLCCRMLRLCLAGLTLSALCLQQVQAVDRSNFKTCEQSSFCKRQRAVQPGQSPYRALLDTLQLSDSRLSLQLLNEHNKVKLLLELYGLQGNMTRIKINELKPLRPRFEVPDVLIRDPPAYPGPQDTRGRESCPVALATGCALAVIGPPRPGLNAPAALRGALVLNERAAVGFSPVCVRLRRPSLSHKISSTVGGLWDSLRSAFSSSPPSRCCSDARKEEEEEGAESQDAGAQPAGEKAADGEAETKQQQQQEEDQQGMWEETFKTHSDTKPHGPSSISLDFSLPGVEHVYGIPEHGDSRRPFGVTLPETRRLAGPDRVRAGVGWDRSWQRGGGGGARTPASVQQAHERRVSPPAPPGTQALPPLFALAYHQCRWNYNDQEDVAAVDAGFDEHDIPYDFIWLDIEHTDGKRYFTWDPNKFPAPKDMLQALQAKKRKMVAIVDPHIKVDSGYKIHNEIRSKGFYTKNKDGGDYEGWCWPGNAGYPDFTNPEMRSWWANMFAYDQYEVRTAPLLFPGGGGSFKGGSKVGQLQRLCSSLTLNEQLREVSASFQGLEVRGQRSAFVTDLPPQPLCVTRLSLSPCLPQVWYDVHTFQKHSGGQHLYIPVTLSSIPVFQRGGSIVPRKNRVRRSSSCMTSDPYTLYVALSPEGEAEGELFVDDEHTFRFESEHQFIHRRFVFARGTLSSHNADPSGHFSSDSWVERVVILGASRPSVALLLIPDGSQSPLEFDFEERASVLTLRKPAVNVAADWTILLR
uniref:Glucosidase II alpha subunit a n=1 Tax=Lepisosteus oculatus TaxID=7918 RepID=W5LYQ7_LEPOC